MKFYKIVKYCNLCKKRFFTQVNSQYYCDECYKTRINPPAPKKVLKKVLKK